MTGYPESKTWVLTRAPGMSLNRQFPSRPGKLHRLDGLGGQPAEFRDGPHAEQVGELLTCLLARGQGGRAKRVPVAVQYRPDAGSALRDRTGAAAPAPAGWP